MIIQNTQNNIKTVGDVKVNKISIDANNLEFITTLLSSNLYSNPENSFIREIVSNAWDSHVEAGNTDTPVIIELNEAEKTVAIRDYGTGISPERFQSIYLNIGSSTKRDSNEYIGAFGLGRFSSLACSNTTLITSYYEGVKYTYVMTKEGNSISINLLNTSFTKERNGVEVKLMEINDFTKYVDNLKYLIFFPNVFIDDSYVVYENYKKTIRNINNIKIRRTKDYAICSNLNYLNNNILLLGNVLYPLNTQSIGLKSYYAYYDTHDEKKDAAALWKKINFIQSKGNIALQFNIGELEITPNREEIIYTKKSIEAIKNKIHSVYDCLISDIKRNINIQPNNINDLSILINSDFILYDFFNHKIVKSAVEGSKVYFCDFLTDKISYKGRHIPETINYNYIRETAFPNYYTKPHNKKTRDKSVLANSCLKTFNGYIVWLKNCKSVSAKLLAFIESKYPIHSIFKDISKQDFIEKFLGNSGFMRIKKEPIDDLIIGDLYDYIYSHSIIVDVKNSKEFSEYKSKTSITTIEKGNNRTHTLWRYRKYCLKTERVTFDSYESVVRFLKGIQKSVILLSDIEVKTIDDFKVQLALCKTPYVFRVKNSLYQLLIQENLNNFVHINNVLSPHKISVLKAVLSRESIIKYKVRKLGTIEKLIVKTFIPEPYSTEIIHNIVDIKGFYKSNAQVTPSILLEYINKNYSDIKEDSYTIKLLDIFEKYVNALSEITEETSIVFNGNSLQTSVLALYLLKKHKLRVEAYTYKSIYKQPLIKILWNLK